MSNAQVQKSQGMCPRLNWQHNLKQFLGCDGRWIKLDLMAVRRKVNILVIMTQNSLAREAILMPKPENEKLVKLQGFGI